MCFAPWKCFWGYFSHVLGHIYWYKYLLKHLKIMPAPVTSMYFIAIIRCLVEVRLIIDCCLILKTYQRWLAINFYSMCAKIIAKADQKIHRWEDETCICRKLSFPVWNLAKIGSYVWFVTLLVHDLCAHVPKSRKKYICKPHS